VHSLVRQAFQEAIRHEDGYVGAVHLTLALLSRPSVGAEVLAEQGLTYDRVATTCGPADRAFMRGADGTLREVPAVRYDPAKGLSGPNPDGQQVVGRAEGLAIAVGVAEPAAEHWLLALLYSPAGAGFPALLRQLGAQPSDLLDGLRRRGVPVPDLPLDDLPPIGPPPPGLRSELPPHGSGRVEVYSELPRSPGSGQPPVPPA
jgi:hypothetical protein